MSFKIAVLASTNGTDLQAIIDELKAGKMPGIELTGVLSNTNCYAVERAAAQGYETHVYTRRPTRDREMVAQLQSWGVDLVVLVGYMRILSPEFVDTFRGRIINVHPSLLPKFAGGMDGDVHQAVIDAGETETGCTIHYVTEELDAGEIILQESCPVKPGETAESLKAKVQALEKKWLPEIIRGLAKKT